MHCKFVPKTISTKRRAKFVLPNVQRQYRVADNNDIFSMSRVENVNVQADNLGTINRIADISKEVDRVTVVNMVSGN